MKHAMNWGTLQRECHQLMDEIFDTKRQAYGWLNTQFHVTNFSKLDYVKDRELLQNIYDALYVRSIIGE